MSAEVQLDPGQLLLRSLDDLHHQNEDQWLTLTIYLLLSLFDREEFVVEVWRLTLARVGVCVHRVDVGQDAGRLQGVGGVSASKCLVSPHCGRQVSDDLVVTAALQELYGERLPSVLLGVPQQSSRVLLPVAAHQAGSAVHQDEPGARDGGGNVESSPPGQTLHVQHLHAPHHTELQVVAGGHPAGHHDLAPPTLRELDAGVVHTANLQRGHGPGVQLRGVVGGGDPAVVYKVIEMNVRGRHGLRVGIRVSILVRGVGASTNNQTWDTKTQLYPL